MSKRTTPIIIGNWKTNPATKELAVTFIKQLDKKCVASKVKLPKKAYYLAVPDIFIPPLSELSSCGYIGAQNSTGISLGQITGATTPLMLASGGASFTLLGHSEVRKQGETSETVSPKVALSLQSKLTTVLCIGEEKRDKEGVYLELLEKELTTSLALAPKHLLSNLIIAYEPVWAVGKDVPATPAECFEAVIALRRALATFFSIDYAKKIHIIYGGDVKADTANTFLTDGGVDGLLIGRASQDVSSFLEILKVCHSA